MATFVERVGNAWRAALLAISAYALPPSTLPGLDSKQIERARAAYGGQLSLQPPTRTRWYLKDVETAEYLADGGDLTLAGQLSRAMDKDGVLAGVMSTRAGGLVRLPKRWRGPADMVDELQRGGTFARSTFDEMFPSAELERFVADGIKLGVAIGELVPVEGRAFPVFVRRLPEYLVFRIAENRWYFRSAFGLIPIVPGDGRWILHAPGGRECPWQAGLWRALSRAYVTKDHARNHRDVWEAKLAHPARVAVAPLGVSEDARKGWFAKVMAWGVNTVFSLTPGYDVKLVESNGRGHESFRATIAEQDREVVLAIAGQTVTTDGGAGFSNAGVHESIRADLIQADAEALCHTINTQGIPPWVAAVFGVERLDECPTLEIDTTPPGDASSAASALVTAATAITSLTEALGAHGYDVDVVQLAQRFAIPVRVRTAPAANDAPTPNADAPKLSLVREAAA